jgi:hypothetical protein
MHKNKFKDENYLIRRLQRLYEIVVPQVGMVIRYASLYTTTGYSGCRTHADGSSHIVPSKSWDCSTERVKLMSRTDKRFVQPRFGGQRYDRK